MKYDSTIFINGREISIDSPVYFIADVASNHDGELTRAKDLIWLAKKAGADAVKFQHFRADKIVSDYGFKKLGGQISHQDSWKKSVYEIYKECECNRDWNEELAETASEARIDFLTSPYDAEAIDMLDPYLPAYKIGSGDITWTGIIETIAKKGKPVILATGASNMDDVERAVAAVLKHNRQIALLQCNTNYTGSLENFKYINLKTLQTYSLRFPSMVLGLSDHTPGHATVLGAIALGARVIEKHFTDDNNREGPDHPFSMNPLNWKEMVDRSRELELALGDGIKRVEKNETETVMIQRRCLRLKRNMEVGAKLTVDDLEPLRPIPRGSLEPYHLAEVVGQTLAKAKEAGEALYTNDLRK